MLCAGAAGGCGATSPTCGEHGDAETSFIALDCDFARFRQWERFDLGSAPIAGHTPGPRFAYVNRRPPAGAREFPTGTIVVKTVESVAGSPDLWEIFAMVRRGGGYNAAGAVGWEFFRLHVLPDGRVVTLARGLAPSDGAGDIYDSGTGDGCNGCHGTTDARAHDAVLSPQLYPEALAR